MKQLVVVEANYVLELEYRKLSFHEDEEELTPLKETRIISCGVTRWR